MRREGIFHPTPGGPAEPGVQRLFIAADGGRVEKALAGPCEPAGGVDQPRTGDITDAAARGSHIVPLLGDVGPDRCQRGDDRVRGEIIWKGDVGFQPEQHPGRQLVIVAGLHAADHAAKGVAGRAGRGIRKHGG